MSRPITDFGASASDFRSSTQRLPAALDRLPHAGDRTDLSRCGLTAQDDIFARLGASAVQHSPRAQGAGHIIGTARMGDDPKTSVVDRDLRSHDHHNLFVLGSAVFPTSATANPTLTIAALSLRAVATVKAALAG